MLVLFTPQSNAVYLQKVPQFLLDDWLLNYLVDNQSTCEIICTQPRRLSAIGVAERVAEERNEKIGGTVGYQVSSSFIIF